MQTQKLCLKWNNHTTNFLSVLESFQKKGILVDVTISCEGQIIKAHKMVLSACSPYFQNIFLDNPCKHPVVIINGIKYDDITAILNFMYKGEVNVSQDGLSSFLQAAEALKVKGLAEVCGEKKSSTNSINQEVQQNEQNRPQRTDTPPRKRHRNRKRSASDSNRSDDEGTSRKNREPSSPEIHELSGDESFTGDNTSNGPPFNSVPRVPQNLYSRSHQSSSNLVGEEDDDFEVEPSKLLEQTLTTESVSMNNSNSDNNLRIERIIGNATEIESSSMQEPESPPDIKPIIDYGESSAGPSDGNLMLYSEQSQPGPSNMQDGSLLHDNSHAQGVHGRGNISNSYKSNRMCETTRLLKELKEDPVCLCHSSNSGLLEVPMENELSSNVQKENMKCLKRSKQLLIYNEEGCMKGLELNKGIVSDASTNLNDLQLSANYIPILQDGTTFVEDEYCSNRNFQSNNSTIQSIERNLSFLYKPRNNNDTTESDARETGNQSYTHYTVMEKPVEKNRPVNKSGQRKSAKRQSKKSHSTSSSLTDLHSGNEHSVPCTVLEKQSYTQVSVEEDLRQVSDVSQSIEKSRNEKEPPKVSEKSQNEQKSTKFVKELLHEKDISNANEMLEKNEVFKFAKSKNQKKIPFVLRKKQSSTGMQLKLKKSVENEKEITRVLEQSENKNASIITKGSKNVEYVSKGMEISQNENEKRLVIVLKNLSCEKLLKATEKTKIEEEDIKSTECQQNEKGELKVTDEWQSKHEFSEVSEQFVDLKEEITIVRDLSNKELVVTEVIQNKNEVLNATERMPIDKNVKFTKNQQTGKEIPEVVEESKTDQGISKVLETLLVVEETTINMSNLSYDGQIIEKGQNEKNISKKNQPDGKEVTKITKKSHNSQSKRKFSRKMKHLKAIPKMLEKSKSMKHVTKITKRTVTENLHISGPCSSK